METKEFAEALVGQLARDNFHTVGSLAAYLALPERDRGGDEANIVDSRISRLLLEALGYGGAEIDYNAGKDNLRPDFVVRIRAFPGCCFIVEDKATVERRLESHRPQLGGYMAAFRCPRGLLVNGERVFGYDDTGPVTSATLQVSLHAAVRIWRGEDRLAAGQTGWDALPQPDRDALAVLLRRYGRAAFEGVGRLVEDLTLDQDGNPHLLDGSTWRHGRTRILIADARGAADHLVQVVQELIGELREDVAVQFAARLAEHEAFRDEIRRAPGSTVAADDIINHHADDLLALWPRASAEKRNELRERLYRAMRGDLPDTEIDSIAALIRVEISGRTGTGADALSRAAGEARAFALRYSRHVTRARARHVAGVQAVEAFERWQAAVGTLLLPGANPEKARDEYFAQTAYLVVVRMLMVRVLEDKGLTPRVFTNGGAALWFRQVEPHYFSLARGRSTARLLEIAYENAQSTYAHFFDDHRVFDWYVPDRITVIRVLHRLAGFDLSSMDRDIVGTIYGRFVNERHKHEQGMYYTPPSVVAFILDRVGWSGAATVEARLLDPACGSGAFLVEAARRAVEAYREQARAEGHAEIPPERIQAVLDSLRNGLVGFDLNPFACALAEINLLVQVLDLVAHAHRHNEQARLERFRIYATDALRVLPAARAILENGLDPSEAEDLPDEEQAKSKLGIFASGFDVVVGNPPYVRADEGAEGLLRYRRQVENHPILQRLEVLTQKWDLFVPFVALGLHLLRNPEGRLGMIVSNALETVLYAGALRRHLATTATVEEVHFFEPGVKLFADAVVRNTIVILRRKPPSADIETLRDWHADAPPNARRRQLLRQATYGAEVFRPALPALRVPANVAAHAVKHICYVSVGMVLNAHERLAQGQFRLDDLLVDHPDAVHPRPYVGSEDLRLPNATIGDFPFAPMRVRYLEYGTERVPALIRRPTFPELYDREKLMAGEFGSVVHDDGRLDPLGFLVCNHSVFQFVPWHSLAGVRNRALLERERDVGRLRSEMEVLSRLYPLPFLAGLLNSSAWATIMAGRAATSIAGRAQPNDYADQAIPVPEQEIADAVGQAATAARREGHALAALLAAGWQRHPQGWRSPPTVAASVQQGAFGIARTRWGLTIERPTIRCATLRREGETFVSGERVAARLPAGTDQAAADFLLRVLNAQGVSTLQSVEAGTVAIPLRPLDASATERALLAAERAALAREQVIMDLRSEIDALVGPLFEAVPQPPIKDITRLGRVGEV
nr:N-6 DNA methylase [uncultured Rhodopila sp.]